MLIGRNSKYNILFIAAFCVMSQVVMALVQIAIIDIYNIDETTATQYRVWLAAIPMILAFFIVFPEKKRLWITTYIIALFIMLIHTIFFPSNEQFIWGEGTRFTLPIVLASALVVISISDVNLIERAMYIVSWLAFFVAVIYFLNLILGRFVIENYNMGFSYSLLLPILTLYKKKCWYSVIAAAGLLIGIIFIGSRGAVIISGIYIFVDIIAFNRTSKLWGIMVFAMILFLIPLLELFMGTIGISSRTLQLIYDSELLSHDSGRGDLYEIAYSLILQHPITGVGIFGDRVYCPPYVHSFIYELWLNWGIILGSFFCILYLFKFLSVFFKSSFYDREILLRYFCAGVAPLFVSSSYLISLSFGIYTGILVVFAAKVKVKYIS